MIEIIIAAVTASSLGAFAVTDAFKAAARRRPPTPPAPTNNLVYVQPPSRKRAA